MKALVLALILAFVLPFVAANPTEATDCQFVLGFKTLHGLITDIVGECKTDQRYNIFNGDSLQDTTRGLLVWRKADNFTAFTDGYHTWVNGPYGMQERLNTERFDWEAQAPIQEKPPTAAATPTPYVLRQYPQVLPDCYVHMVTVWSDGRTTTEKLRPAIGAERGILACYPPESTPGMQPTQPPSVTPAPRPPVNAPSMSGLYRVNLTRRDSNLYKDSGGVLFITRDCYEYAYSKDAVYDADRSIILFGTTKCDVADVITKYFESYINGTFEGWNGKTIFPLGNGQVWQQASYSYWYHYAYNPQVIIYEASDATWMRVQDVDETIMVRRLR